MGDFSLFYDLKGYWSGPFWVILCHNTDQVLSQCGTPTVSQQHICIWWTVNGINIRARPKQLSCMQPSLCFNGYRWCACLWEVFVLHWRILHHIVVWIGFSLSFSLFVYVPVYVLIYVCISGGMKFGTCHQQEWTRVVLSWSVFCFVVFWLFVSSI